MATKLTPKMNEMIIEQIAREKFNANLYQYIGFWFYNKQLKNIGNYFMKQAEDELGHAKKFIDYLTQRVSSIFISKMIEEVNVDFGDVQEIGEAYINQETDTTQHIYELVEQSETDKDYMTRDFLIWYVNEQTAEEDEADEFLQKASRVFNDNGSLELWDATFAD